MAGRVKVSLDAILVSERLWKTFCSTFVLNSGVDSGSGVEARLTDGAIRIW